MVRLSTFLLIVHLVGLALGVGSATLKMILLVKCYLNREYIPVFLKVTKPVTMLLIMGIIFLTLSGIGWLIMGYAFTPLMIAKVVLVGLMWVTGILIDNVFTPKFARLAPVTGSAPSLPFLRIERQNFAIELLATLTMYAITIMGVFL